LDSDFLVIVGDLVFHASDDADEFARMWDGFDGLPLRWAYLTTV